MNQRKKGAEEKRQSAAAESLLKTKSNSTTDVKKTALPLVVAGIGASAGGLEAFQRLLSGLDDASNLALVFVQHLDPSAKTLLPELLSKTTTMEVVEIKGRKKLKPNTVYICPPQALLSLKKGFIGFVESESKRPLGAIDHFFYAVADDLGERGVGVILSGAGSDGTLGLKAISDHGGFTLAQDSETAKYDSMPRSAATTGVADFVLPPDKIAVEIQNYVRHLQELENNIAPKQMQASIEEAIPVIAERLLEMTNHNFQHYKTNTLVRRIQRRMQVLKIGNAGDYVNYLQYQNDEVRTLFRELLIGVTHFFRDPDAFAALQHQVLPKLFEKRHADDCVRIWLAGCANGAEAYTMAILCREVMDDIAQPCKLQIFATDIDERALQIARSGTYPSGIAENISASRLKRFFDKHGKQYCVKKDVRELVLFSSHNLISDPPYSRQDLILCRNLLIYLGSHLQDKLIPLFHYALRPGGYLFLGPSESITAHGDLFRPVDARHRISQRKRTSLSSAPVISLRQNQTAEHAENTRPDDQTDLTAMAQRIVLDEFAPRYAVIDDSGRIRNASPNIDRYIRFSGGDYQNNIIKMVAGGLRIGLRAAISEAKKSRRRVDHEHLSMRVGDKTQRVMLTIQPMPRLGEDEPLLMVIFHDVGLPADTRETEKPSPVAGPGADSVIAQMELELETARHDLDRSLQDMESVNEELKSSNEELLSMNEELQSANEELETSKEEIRASSDAVARANADLENLLRSTQIATVFLDEKLRIRSFTPALNAIYDLIPTDIGRPLEKFVPAVIKMPPLPDPKVLDEKASIEHTVLTHSGKAYIRRVLPYRSHTGKAEGIVVTFTDVSKLRQSEDMLKRSLVGGQLDAFQTDLKTMKIHRQGSVQKTLGLDRQSSVEEFYSRIHHDDAPAFHNTISSVTPDKPTYKQIYRVRKPDGDCLWLSETAEITFDQSGEAIFITGIYQDVSAEQTYRLQLEAREQQLADTLERLELSLATSGAATWSWDADKDMPVVNETMKQMFGFGLDESPSFGDFASRFHEQDRHRIAKENLRVMRDGGLYKEEYRIVLPAGDIRWLRAVGKAVHNASGKMENFYGVALDITDQKTRELEAIDREAHLRRVIDNTLNFVGVLDKEGTLLEANQTAVAAAGINREDVIGKPFWECYWWAYDDTVSKRLRHAIIQAQNGEVVRYDETVRMANDSRMVIDFMLTPVRDSNHHITHLIPSGADITERIRQEKHLADALSRLDLALSASGAAVWGWDVSTNQPFGNESLSKLYGFETSARPQLSDFFARLAAEDRGRVAEAMQRSIAKGGPYEEEYRVILPSDDVRWLRSVGRSELGADGKLKDFYGVVFDSTDRKQRELDLIDRETEIRHILDNQLNFCSIIDATGTLIEINARMLSASGLPREQFIGKKYWETDNWQFDADKPQQIRHNVKRALAGEVIRYDTVTWLNGQLVDIDLLLAPVKDAAGKVTHVIPSAVDISRRKQFENEIRLSEERLRMAARVAGFGTFYVDLDKEIVLWSDEMLEILGLPPNVNNDGRIGEVPHFVHPEDREKVAYHLSHVLTNTRKTDHLLEHRIVRPDHSVRYVRMQSRLLCHGKGKNRKGKNIIGTVLDITSQRINEEKLEAAKVSAEAANQSKSEFLANMSHEIRTPMSAILGYADILSQHLQDADNLNCVSVIRSNGEFLLEIINDILDISRIEAGKIELVEKTTRLDQLIVGVRSLMQVRAVEKSLNFWVELDGEVPQSIHTDPIRLRQILINLVSNAIKFTKTGSVKLIVRYLADAESASLQFAIIDTGIGIAAALQGQVFEPFVQGEASVNRNYGGSGLGLTISQRLAKMLGGEITVDSVAGQGSTFTLTIDIGEPRPGPFINQSSLDQVPTSASSEAAYAPKLTGRILVVDDRREIRFIAEHIIEEAGATVVTADNGQQALEAIEQAVEIGKPFDILVIDMQMPVLDGYETTRRLRKSGFVKPVIALTAHAMEGDRERCLQAGCTDYIVKPLDAPIFTQVLHRYLTQRPESGNEVACRILLIDDSQQASEALTTLLTMKGFKVESALDGENGIALAQSFRPEFILLDLGLPDMTGFEVLASLQNNPDLSQTRFIAATGHNNIEETSSAGFHHHILKPVDIDALVEWINSFF